MASLPDCILRTASSEECHKTTYCRKTGLRKFCTYTDNEQELLLMRSGSEIPADASVCMHHEKLYLNKYEFLQKACCDPFRCHKASVRKSLRSLDIQAAKTLQSKGYMNVKPGMKVCPQCYKKIETCEESSMSEDSQTDPWYVPEERSVAFSPLNETLTAIGCSPLKVNKLNKSQVDIYTQKKVAKAQKRLSEQLDAVGGTATTSKATKDGDEHHDCICLDYQVLLEALKEKCRISPKQEQVQILTLAPASWTIEKTASEFGVTNYLVRKSRDLRKSDGVLAYPKAKSGHGITAEVKQQVVDFYESDDISRMCPGMKDYVSVKKDGKRVQMQKRLILCNLNEVHRAFKEKFEVKIGISKFCELRPKWCITVGAKGTHSVCVCTIHQNVKLMTPCIGPEVTYHTLIQKMVCDEKSKECMLHRCEHCPGEAGLREYLQTQLQEDTDDEDIIRYKQWVHTDRTTLVTQEESCAAFINNLVTKVDQLTKHHFIAKAQSAHLSSIKENLPDDTVVLCGDFSENYSFIIQDAAQGFHWDNSQATLHPFVAYVKLNGELKALSYCIVSDYLKHDTVAVHTFQTVLVPYLMEQYPAVKKFIYFSDGAASQYKNFKNMSNLCNHSADFGATAEWHFFATSHGKGPCDGVGGTVKRLAARASLQSPREGHILTPEALFTWARQHIPGIKFFYVNTEEVLSNGEKLEARFTNARSVKGIRDNHCFVPESETQLKVSRVSGTDDGFICSVSKQEPDKNRVLQEPGPDSQPLTILPGQYVACVYDNSWWIGIVFDLSAEFEDLQVKFMHPKGPSKKFTWPRKDDVVWVPTAHILCPITAPSTRRGGQYHISGADDGLISEKFKQFKGQK